MSLMRKETPGNEHAFARLREVLDSGDAIAFVGAGASAGLYPLWDQLIRQLAEEAVARGLATEENRTHWLRVAGDRPQQAVRGIKRALGDAVYGATLRRIFRPKTGSDGNRFAPIQGAVLRMPFRGYVTTNYDPGLIEARLVLRPDVSATGYATWRDQDVVQQWYTGDIFSEERCPILFAHGIYERSDSIVLGVSEYREAYRPGLYRRVFEKLWGQDRLVFVGFSFSDPWLDYLADEVVTQSATQLATEPRHVALIGLRDDEGYSAEMRRMFQDQYNAEIYLYRVAITETGEEDHSDLVRVLEGLAGSAAENVPPPVARQLSVPATERPPQCWIHETTNDDRYVEPSDALARLDRWARDMSVRVIAVTGLGGLGKTALIGHWLKCRGGDVRRPNDGLFFWSFYADRRVAVFLKSLLRFAARDLKLPVQDTGTRPAEAAKALLQTVPLLVVLDGMEVLQDRPGSAAYGALLTDDIRDLLDAACRVAHDGLVVLTSRFPFTDLVPYLGTGLRVLDLDNLAPAQGAALLKQCDVGGTDAERRKVSERLEGHPLALRVFAAAAGRQAHGEPTRLFEMAFDDVKLREDEPLERKLRHLLAFYEKGLPAQRTALLGVISLFQTPLDQTAIRRLGQVVSGAREILCNMPDESLQEELEALCNDHLLLRDRSDGKGVAYSCHPVLRDHFRRALLSRDDSVASDLADLLADQPANERPKDIWQVQPVLAAIDLLLESGDFVRADELFRGRLEDGRIFRRLPAPGEGMRLTLGFVADQERRRQCERQLSQRRLSYYLNEVGGLAFDAGELWCAARFFEDAREMSKQTSDGYALSLHTLNHAEVLTYLGQLSEAESLAAEAVSLTKEFDDESTFYALSRLGYALMLKGHIGKAMEAFEEASETAQRIGLGNSDQLRPSASWGSESRRQYVVGIIWWADLLIRLGHVSRAGRLARGALRTSELNNQFDNVARCHWILGRLDTVEGRLVHAGNHLACAESTMRRGHMLSELPSVLLAHAALHRQLEAWDEARRCTEEALRLAAPRGLRLSQADALILRARILLERALGKRGSDSEESQTQLFRAQEDAQAGLALARQCPYAWAERDALEVLADTCGALGNAGEALSRGRDAEALTRRLRLGPAQ